MKYQVVISGEIHLIEVQVAELIAQGWEPIGGISACVIDDDDREIRDYTFLQAMIKRP